MWKLFTQAWAEHRQIALCSSVFGLCGLAVLHSGYTARARLKWEVGGVWCCNNGCFLPMTDCCILVWGLPLFDIACVTDTVTPITYIWSNQRLTGVLCLNLATCSCSENKDCTGSFGTTAMQLRLSKSSRAGRRSQRVCSHTSPIYPPEIIFHTHWFFSSDLSFWVSMSIKKMNYNYYTITNVYLFLIRFCFISFYIYDFNVIAAVV